MASFGVVLSVNRERDIALVHFQDGSRREMGLRDVACGREAVRAFEVRQ